MKIIIATLSAALAVSAQSLVPQGSAYAPCPSLDYPGVIAADSARIYYPCANGSVFVFDHFFGQPQANPVALNPISGIDVSNDPSEYFVYVTTVNGDRPGNYVGQLDKRNPAVAGSVLAEKNWAHIVEGDDADLIGLKVIGIDLVVSGIRFNHEENRSCSVDANDSHIFATCGKEPLRVVRGNKVFDPPKESEYKPGSTVVYSHAGLIVHQLDNAELGCPATVRSNARLIVRTCAEYSGKGVLINSASNPTGTPVFFREQWASVAVPTTVNGKDYVAVGTNSGQIILLEPNLGAGTVREAARLNLATVYGLTQSEKYRSAYETKDLFTDFRVRAIAAQGDLVVLHTKPRFGDRQSGFSVWNARPGPAATLSSFRIK